ncbi:unnamed protein product [Pylaiella littoralis]
MFGAGRGFRGFRPRNSTSQGVHLGILTVIGVTSEASTSVYARADAVPLGEKVKVKRGACRLPNHVPGYNGA